MTDFPDSGQLDLFEHSRAVALANEVIDALLARDAALATERFNGLCIEEPGHRACESLQTLCRALGEWPRPSANPAEVAEAVRWLDGSAAPTADATVPLSEFATYAPGCERVFVTENRINFLTTRTQRRGTAFIRSSAQEPSNWGACIIC